MNPSNPLRTLFAFTLCLSLPAALAVAHCEIPCGIYNDDMRFQMIEEDITTLEKSMNEINRLSKEGDKNYNQLVRWIANKDTHADKLTEVVTVYFMAQRLKPSGTDDAAYVKKLTLLHSMMVEAMKAKQTTDLEHIKALRDLTAQFRDAYFTAEEKKHLEEHKSAKGDNPVTEKKPEAAKP